MASSADVYTSAYFALQNACWGVPQTPLFCIFQCRLRVPAGRFLSDDTFRLIENLHKVRCSFCQRSILYSFRYQRIQKRNVPFLHTVRKLFLRQQRSLPAHFRGSVSVQNVGSMKSSVAIFRQLHHGIVVNPEMAEPEPAANVLHPQTAYREYTGLIGTVFENCDRRTRIAVLKLVRGERCPFG